MAFKRKQRKIINFDFEYKGLNDTEILHFEVEHSKELSDKLNKVIEATNKWNDNDTEQLKEYLTEAYDTILGKGAMAEIKEKVYENDNLLLTDLLDIGYYLIEEINKANSLISKEYGMNRVNDILNEEIIKDKELYTADDVAKMLNYKSNGLPN